MKYVQNPHDLKSWIQEARDLVQAEIPPNEVEWVPSEELYLELENPTPLSDKPSIYEVPKAFLILAETVACHRNPEKWALLYCILWKLIFKDKHLLQVGLDESVRTCQVMIKQVRRDCHKMKAFVRFRALSVAENSAEKHYVSWYEPEHLIVQRMAPFFQKRFTQMRWSILTPDECMHWNGKKLFFSNGASKVDAPEGDDYENLWLTYYQNTFNAARLKVKAMQTEMPKKYWKNLPEATLIESLIEKGQAMDISRKFDAH